MSSASSGRSRPDGRDRNRIDAVDFKRLWTLRRETLSKTRYSWADGRFHWDTDFFKTSDGRTYFALAEVEMPEHERQPPECRRALPVICWARCTLGDPRFTSKRLADQSHAEALLAEIRAKGSVS